MSTIKIGFPLGLNNEGGPSNFLKSLKNSYKSNNLLKTSIYLDPTVDLIISSSIVRNPWNKPHIMRLDGIYYGSHINKKEIDKKNSPIINGIKNAKGLIFQSKFSKFIINNFFSVNPKIPNTIINNGVDLKKFSKEGYNLRENLGIKNSDLVFITSANFRAQKRLEDIINSFINYKKIVNKNMYLIIIGNLDKRYRDLPKEIIFTGKIKHSSMSNWYRTADVCLFYSILDWCPNNVVEALASKLPVLCTNLGGTRELIELTNGGIIVDADQEVDFKNINLENPPKPDQGKILNGIHEIVKNKNGISNKMNTKFIDINFVSKKYYEFINKLQI